MIYQFQSVFKEFIVEIYADTIGGDLDKIIGALHDPFMRELDEGQRIVMLIAGWFILLFAFEAVIRIVLFLLSFVLGLVWRTKTGSSCAR